MDRRHFLGLSMLAGLAAGVAPSVRNRLFAQAMDPPDPAQDPYTGTFYIFVNAGGGWDPTMVCDPKGGPINAPYMPSEIAHTGNHAYAPINYTVNANPYSNQAFFTKYGDRLLALNGVDMSTNNHDGGTRFTWSGHLEDGYPPLAALIAAALAPGKPLAFLSNGGYEYTAGIAPLTRLDSVDAITRIAYPNRPDPANVMSAYHSTATLDRIRRYQHDRLAALQTSQTLPVYQDTMRQLLATRGASNLLERLTQFLPTGAELTAARSTPILAQGMIALAAYQAGITAAVNLSIGGFDTHGDHDRQQGNALGQLLYGVDQLMDRVEALHLRDKVVVVIGSDFGRTPVYNENRGKDHWAVTSMMMMGAGITGNRVIGATDDGFRARNFDVASLTAASTGTVKLNPKQIHLALRAFAGVNGSPVTRQFPIAAETVALFG
ncbi:MAG: DUF1501 domain-containing protein [Deltaproteobacteria bacterium]